MNRGISRTALVLTIVALNIGLDQYTKVLARLHLSGQPPQSYLNDFFRLTYAENRGAFLSLGAGLSDGARYWVLHLFPVVLLAVLLVYTILNRKLDRWQIWSLAFIIGGGISNIYDRLLYGQVTDFMNMGFPGLRTGIFNFADVSIMIGLGLMLPSALRRPPAAAAPPPSA